MTIFFCACAVVDDGVVVVVRVKDPVVTMITLGEQRMVSPMAVQLEIAVVLLWIKLVGCAFSAVPLGILIAMLFTYLNVLEKGHVEYC